MNSTDYYFNGVKVENVAHASGMTDARVRRFYFMWIRNPGDGSEVQIADIDDLTISACSPICGDPVFDTDLNGEVDSADLANISGVGLQDCITGPSPAAGVFDSLSVKCKCLDYNGDQAIDMVDFAGFQQCYSAGTPPWMPARPVTTEA